MVQIFRVLAKLGIISGSNYLDYCNKRYKAKIYQMSRKAMDSAQTNKSYTKRIW